MTYGDWNPHDVVPNNNVSLSYDTKDTSVTVHVNAVVPAGSALGNTSVQVTVSMNKGCCSHSAVISTGPGDDHMDMTCQSLLQYMQASMKVSWEMLYRGFS